WVVNGREMQTPLAGIIALAREKLDPARLAATPSCLSHGDDHFGNLFFIEKEWCAFDPAFAGRHPALLAILKGAVHNAPLHPFWYYEPERVLERLKLEFRMDENRVRIDHNGAELLHTPLREKVAQFYVEKSWKPVLRHLARMGGLPQDWRETL